MTTEYTVVEGRSGRWYVKLGDEVVADCMYNADAANLIAAALNAFKE